MNEESSLEKLYEEFKSTLSTNGDDLYFDEQDLIDIFDYAGDVNDDYVRLEVLTLASRLFPHSKALRHRHALLLSDINPDSFRNFVDDENANADSSDLTWAIINAKANPPTGENAVEFLENLLKHFDFEEDEDTIQFVNLVAELDQVEWLVDNLERIKSRFEYTPTLIYESAQVFNNAGLRSKAIELMDEMTMQEPFNINYWLFLAEMQAANNALDDALNSIEYAKAINAEDFTAIALEGYIHLLRPDYVKAIPALEKAHQINPDDNSTKRNLVEAYRMAGRNSEAIKLMHEIFFEESADRNIMQSLLLLCPDETVEILEKYYKNVESDTNAAAQNIYEIYHADAPESALRYAIWYSQNISDDKCIKLLIIELLYSLNQYNDVVTYALTRMQNLRLEDYEMHYVAILASALMKMKMFKTAQQLCDKWIPLISRKQPVTIQNRLMNRGTLQTLINIQHLLLDNPNPSGDEVDSILI